MKNNNESHIKCAVAKRLKGLAEQKLAVCLKLNLSQEAARWEKVIGNLDALIKIECKDQSIPSQEYSMRQESSPA